MQKKRENDLLFIKIVNFYRHFINKCFDVLSLLERKGIGLSPCTIQFSYENLLQRNFNVFTNFLLLLKCSPSFCSARSYILITLEVSSCHFLIILWPPINPLRTRFSDEKWPLRTFDSNSNQTFYAHEVQKLSIFTICI